MPDPHQTAPFDVALRGYDRDQVDAHLASIESEFTSALTERDRLADRVKALETRVEELHLQPDDDGDPHGAEPAQRGGPPLSGFGARVEKILRIAEEEATEVREETRAEIERERAEASKKVGAIREAAEKDAAAHRRKVEQEAAQLLDRARQEAARVRAEAEAHAGATREEASGHLESVRAKAAQAAADFETALAKRRQKAEADHIARTNAADRELAETVARTDQLRAEAEKMRADAERRSQEMLQAAQRESGELVAEARAQADRTRRESERELSTLSKRRDAITDQLRNVREMLSTLTGGVSSAAAEPEPDARRAGRGGGTRAAPGRPAGPERPPVVGPRGEPRVPGRAAGAPPRPGSAPSRPPAGWSGADRVHHDVVPVGPLRVVERAAAGDQSERPVRGRSVHPLGRERLLRVALDPGDGEPREHAVGAADLDDVAGLELPQPEEDGRPGPGVHVPGDHRRPGLAGRRTGRVPAGLAVVRRRLELAAARDELERDQRRAGADRRDGHRQRPYRGGGAVGRRGDR